MIISDLASMLPGGSEKTPTLKATLTGVSIGSAKLFSLILPARLRVRSISCHRRGQSVEHEEIALRCIVRVGGRSGLQLFTYDHSSLFTRLEDRFKNKAFVRIFEVWGRIDIPLLLRGYKGTRHFEHCMNGKIGANNNSILKREGDTYKPIPEKLTDKQWWKHRNVIPFPDEGIQAARRFANEMKSKQENLSNG